MNNKFLKDCTLGGCPITSTALCLMFKRNSTQRMILALRALITTFRCRDLYLVSLSFTLYLTSIIFLYHFHHFILIWPLFRLVSRNTLLRRLAAGKCQTSAFYSASKYCKQDHVKDSCCNHDGQT